MVTFRAASGASEALRHAIELVNRDLDGLLDELDTHQQNEFWTNLHHYALTQTEHKGRNAHLITSDTKVDEAVREALELADEKFTEHLQGVSARDCDRFWKMLHDVSEEQADETADVRAKHGGGKR